MNPPSHPLEIKTGADWLDPMIWTDAPLYGLTSAEGLSMPLQRKSEPRRRHLQFGPDRETRILEPETKARWDVLPLPEGMEDWAYGELTIPDDALSDYLWSSYTCADAALALLPEAFVLNNLVVSARVRDLIEAYMPGRCHFSVVTFTGRETGITPETPYFNVTVRRLLEYLGEKPKHGYRGKYRVLNGIWHPLCENAAAQAFHYEEPLLVHSRHDRYPILNRAFYKHLKDHNVTGLFDFTDGARPGGQALALFECVHPLNPSTAEARR
ncbi:hypothetical protein [Algicella marina]|uniref:Uncharacterized protein n=1 Tax=Algicella marina TaxID=2683284 RepID=A0A6P1T133_9RHOB|nr:hypothetical protein [Algicella marina]QHQ35353.1 hypothetical protein GO499_09170 [Algicella marina]